jgi:hypothetical protein
LYEVVREHAETAFAAARARSASGTGYPAHVEREFRGYLECGILAHGFVRLHCAGCGRDELVAFSCKGRAVCPSCAGRRMSDTAARLVDERLPEASYRQWVFSFPWRLRVALARDGALLSEVLRACVRKVFVYQRSKARALGIGGAKTLAVGFVQRFGSLLQLNPHAHMAIPDAVWFDGERGELEQRGLEEPSDDEVEAVGLAVVKAVLRVVLRAEARSDADEPDEAATTAALLEAAHVEPCGSRPVVEPGSNARRKRRTAVIRTELGTFSIHANTSVEASDRAGLERLLRYAGRPALSQRRLSRTPTGKLRYRLRKPYYTGQTEVVLEPEAFVRRLAALVPPARQNQVRYYGLLAAQARDRDRLLSRVPGAERGACCEGDEDDEGDVATVDAAEQDAERGRAGRATAGYRLRWARLLARVFGHEMMTCPHCGEARRIIAAITERAVVVKLLAHLGLPTEAPAATPARAPPQLEWCDDDWPVA